MKIKAPSTEIEVLLNSNAPPSENQRAPITAQLRALEAEFKRTVGIAFTKQLEENEVPIDARGLRRSILLHHIVLSAIRRVPEEVWQQIFSACGMPSSSIAAVVILQTICSVGRQWRTAAINHSILWTQIPAIHSLGKIQSAINYLKVYLQRSGALPITWHYYIAPKTDMQWEEQKPGSQDILRLLVGECHRWEVVSLHIPFRAFRDLEPIQGHLPMLKTLSIYNTFDSRIGPFMPGEETYQVDYFSEAPQLRTVFLDMRWSGPYKFRMNFPRWDQFETISIVTDSDEHYHNLALGNPLVLQHFEYTAHRDTLLPSAPSTFPKLKRFVLRVGNPGNMIVSHLDSLTLPSLTELEIRGRFTPADPLFDKVIELIRRSGCPLQSLSLDPATVPCDALGMISALSPGLTHLDVTNFDAEALAQLVLDPTSHSPVLPKLKTLVLRVSERLGTNFAGTLNVAAVMQVVRSRTEPFIENTIDLDLFEPLDEVAFICDNDRMMHLQMLQFESTEIASFEGIPTVDTELGNLASRARRIIMDHCHLVYPQPDSRLNGVNVKLHLKIHKVFQALEKVDLRRHNSQALILRGLPWLLWRIQLTRPGIIPGDRLFNFRSRADKLLQKWKPFLLRDHQAFPLRWTYHDGGVVRLKLKLSNEDLDISEDNLWKEIKGTSYTPTNYSVNSGPTDFYL